MEHYELYHGTKRENVLKIIDSQKFIVNEDEENKLFLGKGAYFYLDKMNAVDWNCRDVANKNKIIFPDFIEVNNMYSIVYAECDVDVNNILDLDTREAIIKYKRIVNKIRKYLESIENYRDKNETATILNLLSKKGLLDGIYVVVRTFPYPVDKKLGITIPKNVVCVKNTEILKNYKKIEMTKEEYNKMKLMYK